MHAAKKKKGGKELHVDGKEPQRALFICYICNYTSSTKTRLIQHIGVGNCNLKANSAKSRPPYTRQTPSNDYVCYQCNTVFKTKRNLDEHIIKMHRESIESIYPIFINAQIVIIKLLGRIVSTVIG
nr:unnamed protein product [Callosobruchus analis]